MPLNHPLRPWSESTSQIAIIQLFLSKNQAHGRPWINEWRLWGTKLSTFSSSPGVPWITHFNLLALTLTEPSSPSCLLLCLIPYWNYKKHFMKNSPACYHAIIIEGSVQCYYSFMNQCKPLCIRYLPACPDISAHPLHKEEILPVNSLPYNAKKKKKIEKKSTSVSAREKKNRSNKKKQVY